MPVDTVSAVSAAPQARVPGAERTSVVVFDDVVVEVDRGGDICFVARGVWHRA